MAKYEFNLPIKEEETRQLKVRDILYLTGEVYTVRDMAYERILNTLPSGGNLPFDLKGKAIWHCGPITRRDGERWKIVSAGSTTSSRFIAPASQLVEKLGVKLIIGKGAMGEETSMALSKHGGAYVITTGGAAAYYANQVEEIKTVYWLDLGMPAAVWVFQVKKLGPLTVAMDSNGGNIFEEIRSKVDVSLNYIYKNLKIDPEHKYIWWP